MRERTEALERAQAQLIQTEKLSSLGKLSASIAHEINNPLAGILTTAKLLIRTIGEEPRGSARGAPRSRLLTLVQRETERCSAIVRNLLGFARERALTLTDADVNAALDEALFLVANQVALLGIELERDLEPLPPVRGRLRSAPPGVRQHPDQRVRRDAAGRDAAGRDRVCVEPSGSSPSRSPTPAWAFRRSS